MSLTHRDGARVHAVVSGVDRGGTRREAHGEGAGDVRHAERDEALRRQPAGRRTAREEPADDDDRRHEHEEGERLDIAAGDDAGQVRAAVGAQDRVRRGAVLDGHLLAEAREHEHDVGEGEPAGGAPHVA